MRRTRCSFTTNGTDQWNTHQLIQQSPSLFRLMTMSSLPRALTRVIIMSSIMEHMCADVFQQTGATLRPPVEGQEPIPYRNLLPAKDPIHMALSKQFQTVLRKGWVDSRALHLFESLLNMGGVFWFTNNLVKVGGTRKRAVSLRINDKSYNYFLYLS